MKKYIFLLFLLCGCVAVFAQQKSTFTVSGQVFDDLDIAGSFRGDKGYDSGSSHGY